MTEPVEFTAAFTITVTGIRTMTVGELTNVVKQVEWTLNGTQEGQSFELPQKTVIADPSPEAFIPLAQVTAANVETWIEENGGNLNYIKSHIQFVLDKMVAEASMQVTPIPWVPAPEPEPEPAP